VLVRIGMALLALVAALALLAPFAAPNAPAEQFADRSYAPPMRIHIRHAGGFRAPFVYRQVLEDRLMKRYREDTSSPVPVSWFSRGKVVSIGAEHGPLLLFGADALGRDILSRLLYGAGLSLGVTLVGVAGALVIGAFIGALAGSAGGFTETAFMAVADFILVLPGAYLVLVLRGLLPDVLSTSQVFVVISLLFAFAAWPHPARGVRAIVRSERTRDYAEAARAAGAGPRRLARHLVPAAWSFLAIEVALLVPALLVAEATISFLGLGFPDAQASWGTMLQDAAHVRVIDEAPWMLAPALALFLVVLGVQFLAKTTKPSVTQV
jgi:peptide/nickel transport system permease protein